MAARSNYVWPAYSYGYTIVEVVLVVVILGIMAAAAGPRFFDNSAFEERAYYDELVSALRYAQKVAVASGCPVRVDVATNAYTLTQQTAAAGHCDSGDASFPVPVLLPDGQAVAGTAPDGVLTSPATTIVYGALGNTSLGANQTVSVGARPLQVQADSGLVTTP